MTDNRQSERALSEVIGLIALLGLITVVLAVHVAYSVPADGRENEIRQMNAVKDSFTGYKTSLDSLWINAPANPAGLMGTYGITVETDIVLGTAGASKDFVSLFPLLKPAGSFGSIRIKGNDGAVRIIKDGSEELLNISIGTMRYQSSNNYWVQQEYIYQMGGVFLSQRGGVINKISPTFSVYNKSNKAAVSITPINVSGSSYVTGGGRVTADTNLLPVQQYYTSTIGAETIRIEIDSASEWEAEAWEKVFRDSAYMNNLPSGWYSTGSSGDSTSGSSYIEITGPSTLDDIDVLIDIFRADFLTTIRGALPGVSSTSTTTPGTTPTSGSPPVAAFSGSPTSGTKPLAVTFSDLSTNSPTSWSWTFGDGNTSALQNPSHTYVTAGTYTVSLTATNTYGFDTETKTNYITVTEQPQPVADFSGSPTSGTRPLTVTFTDLSVNGPTSWAWTFGDGNTSSLQNPSHTYAIAGTYTVTLNATNTYGSDTETKTNYITVAVPAPVADFSGSPTSGERPLTVTFTDLSVNGPTSWAWTFGDGNTSSLQNPSHSYAAAGTYTVMLNASNAGGSDTETKTNYITVTEPVPSVIFFDDFEDGNINGWTYYRAWTTSSPAIGSYSADFWRNGYISQAISTSGYTGINVSFYLGASTSLDSGESVSAYWSPDGSAWNLLKQINNGDPEEDGQLHFFSYVLPATADNNANFALRFSISANRNDEYGYVDNVRVEGYD